MIKTLTWQWREYSLENVRKFGTIALHRNAISLVFTIMFLRMFIAANSMIRNDHRFKYALIQRHFDILAMENLCGACKTIVFKQDNRNVELRK